EVSIPKGVSGQGTHRMATAHFDWYPAHDTSGGIRFDSFDVDGIGCAVTVSAMYSAVQSSLKNCTKPMISQMMRWPPLLLRVQPNPANAFITLQSSETLDDVA